MTFWSRKASLLPSEMTVCAVVGPLTNNYRDELAFL